MWLKDKFDPNYIRENNFWCLREILYAADSNAEAK